jgi:hypothetical protein
MSKSTLLFFEINPGFKEQPFTWDKCVEYKYLVSFTVLKTLLYFFNTQLDFVILFCTSRVAYIIVVCCRFIPAIHLSNDCHNEVLSVRVYTERVTVTLLFLHQSLHHGLCDIKLLSISDSLYTGFSSVTCIYVSVPFASRFKEAHNLAALSWPHFCHEVMC